MSIDEIQYGDSAVSSPVESSRSMAADVYSDRSDYSEERKANSEQHKSDTAKAESAYGSLEIVGAEPSDSAAKSGKSAVSDSAADPKSLSTLDAHPQGDKTGSAAPGKTGDAASPAATTEAAEPTKKPDVVTIPTVEIFDTPTASPDEKGEVINRDVPPATINGSKGDKLNDIAKEHLGPGATDEEIKLHVKEIAKVNHIDEKNADKPLTDDRPLLLPGHTKDGGFVTEDADHNKRTIWHDGVVRVENADKTGYVRKPDGNGGFSEHTWGPKPSDNADLIVTADGKYKIADGPNDKVGHEPKNETERLIAQRQHLNDSADAKITDPKERAQFHKDQQEFEERMQKQVEEKKAHIDQQVKDGKVKAEDADKLKAEAETKVLKESADTYMHTARLLDAKGDQPLTQPDRTKIAEQVLHQAAHPTSIDQGNHNTCNVATIETKLYTNSPSKAAAMVTDVATTGEYKFKGDDGSELKVKLDPKSLQPDREATNNPPVNGERSYASQLFEVTAVNMKYEQLNHEKGTKLKYEQHEPGKTPDTGERIMDYSKTPPVEVKDPLDAKKPMMRPGLTNDEIVSIEQKITGAPNTRDIMLSTNVSDTKTNYIKDEAKLNEELSRLKAEGKLPVTVYVHTENPPFRNEGGTSAGGKGGWHVVTITDYEPAKDGQPAKVQFDNQWGTDADHLGNKKVAVHDLFNSMRDPKDADHLNDVKKDVQDLRGKNQLNLEKETELLRLEKAQGKITDKELSDETFRLAMESARKLNGKKQSDSVTDEDRKEFERVSNDLKELIATLPPAEQQKLKARIAAQQKKEGIDLGHK